MFSFHLSIPLSSAKLSVHTGHLTSLCFSPVNLHSSNLPTPTNTHLLFLTLPLRVSFNSNHHSPPCFPPSFFEKTPVRANLSIRRCPVVTMMGVRDARPYTSSSSQLGATRWLTRQVVSQTADSRNTLTADLEDNGPAPSTQLVTAVEVPSPLTSDISGKMEGKHSFTTWHS